MTFLEALKESNLHPEQEHSLDSDNKFRLFEPIRVKDNHFLSIQASYAHYSTPRMTLPDLEDYTHWEVAIFNDNGFVGIRDVAPDFVSSAELDFHFNESVYAYVSADLVNEIFNALK